MQCFTRWAVERAPRLLWGLGHPAVRCGCGGGEGTSQLSSPLSCIELFKSNFKDGSWPLSRRTSLVVWKKCLLTELGGTLGNKRQYQDCIVALKNGRSFAHTEMLLVQLRKHSHTQERGSHEGWHQMQAYCGVVIRVSFRGGGGGGGICPP